MLLHLLVLTEQSRDKQLPMTLDLLHAIVVLIQVLHPLDPQNLLDQVLEGVFQQPLYVCAVF